MNIYNTTIVDVVLFDNRYSWLHSKSVQYEIKLFSPSLAEDKNTYTAQQNLMVHGEDTQTQM